jgi:V8-like Glu-specific endopeptidase
LTFKNHKIVGVGTGFLIGSDLVLTAAHNIYDRKEEHYFTDITFYPGVSQEQYSNEGYRVISYRIPD